jgi:hypothetical protein
MACPPTPTDDAAMTTTDRAVSRVLLVNERRDAVAQRDPNVPRVRRYRLARVHMDPPASTSRSRAERVAALRRVYD